MSTSTRAVLATASALLALPLVAAPAAADGFACGTVVTADVRLTADLVDCEGPGIVIGADGVTVDLAGHTMSGDGTGAGVFSYEHDRTTVVGGTITGFAQGVDITGGRGSRVQRVSLVGNLVGITVGRATALTVDQVHASANAGSGIDVFQARRLVVRRSTATANGFGGVVDRGSADTRVEDVVAGGNGWSGIVVDQTEGAVITGVTADANEGAGVELGFWATGVSLERSSASSNGASGFAVEEPGNRLSRLVATGNGEYGVVAPAGTVDGGRSTASGNSLGDCVGVVCA